MKCFKADSVGKSYVQPRRWYSRLLCSQRGDFDPVLRVKGGSSEEASG